MLRQWLREIEAELELATAPAHYLLTLRNRLGAAAWRAVTPTVERLHMMSVLDHFSTMLGDALI